MCENPGGSKNRLTDDITIKTERGTVESQIKQKQL